MLKDGLWDVYNDFGMGVCAEICADKHTITRDEQVVFSYGFLKPPSIIEDTDWCFNLLDVFSFATHCSLLLPIFILDGLVDCAELCLSGLFLFCSISLFFFLGGGKQDSYAIRSFKRGIAAQNSRLFAWEIAPVQYLILLTVYRKVIAFDVVLHQFMIFYLQVEMSSGRGKPSIIVDKDEGLEKV